MNRLRDSTSPYLLQHADNPVDWWPWCDEAFAEAARRDVPVLLSVGYAACHWCHVMAHESFEDPGTAALLNEHMVAIKVDREERPDVDAVYMTATQAMTGQGGWPMTVVMTPAKEPFFCGTYLPRPHFQRLVTDLSRAWRTHHEDVTERATQIAAALAENAAATARALREGASNLKLGQAGAVAVEGLGRDYDAARGGFGGAPKFPPSMVLEFLLRHHERTGDAAALDMVCRHLRGDGPRRNVRPARRRVRPVLRRRRLGRAALREDALRQRPAGPGLRAPVAADRPTLAGRVAAETCDWLLRELRTAEGGFASSLDADSEGEEGKFYVWTAGRAARCPRRRGRRVRGRRVRRDAGGTFEHGASVLQRLTEPDDPERFARVRDALLAARGARVRPGRDDKVVAAWNGMAISALAECGLLLARPDFTAAARDAAGLLAGLHLAGGRLVRTSRDGTAGDTAGTLEDYACVAEGFLTLSGVTGETRWLGLAAELLEVTLGSFATARAASTTRPPTARR